MFFLIKQIGSVLAKCKSLLIRYETQNIIDTFAEFGINSRIGYPFFINGINLYTPGVRYIHIGDCVSLGSGVTIYATRAHVYIGNHSFSGPNLTIMTGDHPADIVGKFIADNH